MRPLLWTLFALAAVPASAAPLKLASPGFRCVNVPAAACEFFSDHLAQELAAATGTRVITESEISALIGFERQKQLLGCDEKATSCLAEIAGALGVDALVTGSLGKFGSDYVVTVKILAARDATQLATQSGRAGGDRALIDWFGSAAKSLAVQLAPPPRVRGPRVSPWIPLGAGAAFLLGSGGFYLGANGRLADARTMTAGVQPVDEAALRSTIAAGKTLQTLSLVSLGLGVAGLAAGGVLFAISPRSAPRLAVVPADGGWRVALGGSFP